MNRNSSSEHKSSPCPSNPSSPVGDRAPARSPFGWMVEEASAAPPNGGAQRESRPGNASPEPPQAFMKAWMVVTFPVRYARFYFQGRSY